MRVVYEIGLFNFSTGVYMGIFGILFSFYWLSCNSFINKIKGHENTKPIMIYIMIIIGLAITITGMYTHYKNYYNFHTHQYKIVEGNITNYYKDAKNNEAFTVLDIFFRVDDDYKLFSTGNWKLADGMWAKIYYDETDMDIYKMEVKKSLK